MWWRRCGTRFSQGDRNTSFFHKVTKIHQVSRTMSIFKSGDAVLDGKAAIENHGLAYFTDLYTTANLCMNSALVARTIPNPVSRKDNYILTNFPSMEEVRSMVFLLML